LRLRDVGSATYGSQHFSQTAVDIKLGAFWPFNSRVHLPDPMSLAMPLMFSEGVGFGKVINEFAANVARPGVHS